MKEKIEKYKKDKFVVSAVIIIILTLVFWLADYIMNSLYFHLDIDFPIHGMFTWLSAVVLLISLVLLIVAGILRVFRKNKVALKYLRYAALAFLLHFLFYISEKVLSHIFWWDPMPKLIIF